MREEDHDDTRAGDPDLEAALKEVSAVEAEFLRRLAAHPDFACVAGSMQIMISHRGSKLGGLNRRLGHWYVSKIFVRKNDGAALMKTHGFTYVGHGPRHAYWMAIGPGALGAFRAIVGEMTGVDV